MKPKLPYQLRKKQMQMLLLFGVLVVLFRVGFYILKTYTKEEPIAIDFVTDESPSPQLILTEFDPNDLDKQQWIKIGFTEKQAQTILKYKQAIGGYFLSKEQIKKCYPIQNRYAELAPYILLPETTPKLSTTYSTPKYPKKSLSVKKKFNPDDYSKSDWVALGFTENQADAILKYKQYLGGSFISKEKLKSCFIISEKNYQILEPYLNLPDKSPPKLAQTPSVKSKIHYQNFDPNALGVEDWVKLGFSVRQAEVIIQYKTKKLGGNFTSLEDIRKCYVISEEKFKELEPYIQLKIPDTAPPKDIPPSNISKSEINFKDIDLNKINLEELMAFGFDKKIAYSYINFRNKLGGFVDKRQILEIYNIDKTLAENLVATCYLDTSSVAKYTLTTAPESWLKSHPYFKYNADKIIYYRLSYTDEKALWKFLQVKPEYEKKMKLYLRD